jgi:hypothetical protein
MGNDCHRCGSTLATPGTFCPNCGSPQLLYFIGEDAVGNSTGVPPPALRGVDWKQAIGAAVTFAVPVGLLCSLALPGFAIGFCLWVTAGSVAGVWLYQRLTSAAHRLARGVGTRIGTILGIMAATIAAALNAGVLASQRYLFHGGNAIDQVFQAGIKQGSDNFNSQIPQPSPEQMEYAAHFWAFWSSPDGHAALTLMAVTMWSLAMVIFSTIGGALGVRIFSGPTPPIRNS